MTGEGPEPAEEPAAETLDALIEGDEAGALSFDAPWQARAFGIALALRDRDAVDWTDFQERFVDNVRATDPDRMQAAVESVYYERWLETVEELVVDAGVVDEAEIDRRTEEFATGERDSSEFGSEPGSRSGSG